MAFTSPLPEFFVIIQVGVISNTRETIMHAACALIVIFCQFFDDRGSSWEQKSKKPGCMMINIYQDSLHKCKSMGHPALCSNHIATYVCT